MTTNMIITIIGAIFGVFWGVSFGILWYNDLPEARFYFSDKKTSLHLYEVLFIYCIISIILYIELVIFF